MFSASVNKPCNSSTVVDHGMLPTYKRLDCGCSVDMVFLVRLYKCFNAEMGRTDSVAASLSPIRFGNPKYFLSDSFYGEKERRRLLHKSCGECSWKPSSRRESFSVYTEPRMRCVSHLDELCFLSFVLSFLLEHSKRSARLCLVFF